MWSFLGFHMFCTVQGLSTWFLHRRPGGRASYWKTEVRVSQKVEIQAWSVQPLCHHSCHRYCPFTSCDPLLSDGRLPWQTVSTHLDSLLQTAACDADQLGQQHGPLTLWRILLLQTFPSPFLPGVGTSTLPVWGLLASFPLTLPWRSSAQVCANLVSVFQFDRLYHVDQVLWCTALVDFSFSFFGRHI